VGLGVGGDGVGDGLAVGEGLGMGKGLLSAYWWALLLAWVWAGEALVLGVGIATTLKASTTAFRVLRKSTRVSSRTTSCSHYAQSLTLNQLPAPAELDAE
jgi:hypothetical protein